MKRKALKRVQKAISKAVRHPVSIEVAIAAMSIVAKLLRRGKR